MSFFDDGESDSLSIRQMSLHVVGHGAFDPQPALEDVEQEQFFLARIREIDGSGLFSFNAGSGTKATLTSIANGALNFEAGAQALAEDFSGRHVGSTVEGAFFVFDLSSAQNTDTIYCLLKYDYREAVERQQDGAESHLRRIIEAFVADKRALQKSCLVRVRDDEVVDAVAAQDRMGRSPDLTDYFSAFLGVSRTRDDTELNRNMAEALRQVFVERKDDLPNRDPAAALRVAKDALSQRQQIDNAAIAEAVMVAAGDPQSDEVKSAFEATVGRKLRTSKLTGLAFQPDRQVLRRAPRKRIQTVEGVTIEYPSALEGAQVRTTTTAGGGRLITIETARIQDQTLVRDRTS